MNCKPGDLAVIVGIPDRRVAHQLGTIVRCKTITTSWDGVTCWRIDPIKDDKFARGAVLEAVADRDLRPIRDNDGEDEMLRIVGKPQEVTA